MPILKMAYRNIFRQKRRTLFTSLSMFGGFVMAAVFIGWADGSYGHIIDDFTRHTFGHIQIHKDDYLDRPSIYKTINAIGRLGDKLEQIPTVESWAPRIYSVGLAALEENTTAVRILGIDPQKEDKTTEFSKKVVRGRYLSARPQHEAMIGRRLANILKARLDDRIAILTQAADGSTADDLYSVKAIIDSGDEVSDRTALYLHLRDAQTLLALGSRVHEIAITVHKLSQAVATSAVIRRALQDPALSVETWQVFARPFYVAMKADLQGMWVSLFIIVAIVAVGVLNTVLMSVLERQREYGILKAIGTKPVQIVRLVLAEVSLLALGSIAFGGIVSLGLNAFLSSHGIHLSSAFTYGGMKFQVLQSEVNARSFVIPALTVFLSAAVVGFFPALNAARTDPAKSMRFH
jgi:putative ABC transport system permease protein